MDRALLSDIYHSYAIALKDSHKYKKAEAAYYNCLEIKQSLFPENDP